MAAPQALVPVATFTPGDRVRLVNHECLRNADAAVRAYIGRVASITGVFPGGRGYYCQFADGCIMQLPSMTLLAVPDEDGGGGGRGGAGGKRASAGGRDGGRGAGGPRARGQVRGRRAPLSDDSLSPFLRCLGIVAASRMLSLADLGRISLCSKGTRMVVSVSPARPKCVAPQCTTFWGLSKCRTCRGVKLHCEAHSIPCPCCAHRSCKACTMSCARCRKPGVYCAWCCPRESPLCCKRAVCEDCLVFCETPRCAGMGCSACFAKCKACGHFVCHTCEVSNDGVCGPCAGAASGGARAPAGAAQMSFPPPTGHPATVV
uniref:TNFR-Cys domain-containing protein n=1 Tax=Bicosoecida sp. CB-2014 TaxID=1486930 RepID=A0A7S1CQ59_9STRA